MYLDRYESGDEGNIPQGLWYLFKFISEESNRDPVKVEAYLQSNFSELYE
jgi:hypothetical protein